MQEFTWSCHKATAQYLNSCILCQRKKSCQCKSKLGLWAWQAPSLAAPVAQRHSMATCGAILLWPILAHLLLASSFYSRPSALPPNQGSMKAHGCLPQLRSPSPQRSRHNIRGHGRERGNGEGEMNLPRNPAALLEFSPC